MFQTWLKSKAQFLSKLSCVFVGFSLVLPLKFAVCGILAACFFDYLALKFDRTQQNKTTTPII